MTLLLKVQVLMMLFGVISAVDDVVINDITITVVVINDVIWSYKYC